MTTDVAVIVDEKVKLGSLTKEPSLYKIIFLNDDKTPMEFVVTVIIKFFDKSERDAFDLTMKIHNDGSAVVLVAPYEIAEEKAKHTMEVASRNGFDLKVEIEPED